MANNRRNDGKPAPSPYAMVNIGLEMAVPVVVLLFAGYKADGWWGTDPWLKVSGALLGLLVGFYNFYRRLMSTGGRKS